jgi:hypothetical protein
VLLYHPHHDKNDTHDDIEMQKSIYFPPGTPHPSSTGRKQSGKEQQQREASFLSSQPLRKKRIIFRKKCFSSISEAIEKSDENNYHDDVAREETTIRIRNDRIVLTKLSTRKDKRNHSNQSQSNVEREKNSCWKVISFLNFNSVEMISLFFLLSLFSILTFYQLQEFSSMSSSSFSLNNFLSFLMVSFFLLFVSMVLFFIQSIVRQEIYFYFLFVWYSFFFRTSQIITKEQQNTKKSCCGFNRIIPMLPTRTTTTAAMKVATAPEMPQPSAPSLSGEWGRKDNEKAIRVPHTPCESDDDDGKMPSSDFQQTNKNRNRWSHDLRFDDIYSAGADAFHHQQHPQSHHHNNLINNEKNEEKKQQQQEVEGKKNDDSSSNSFTMHNIWQRGMSKFSPRKMKNQLQCTTVANDGGKRVQIIRQVSCRPKEEKTPNDSEEKEDSPTETFVNPLNLQQRSVGRNEHLEESASQRRQPIFHDLLYSRRFKPTTNDTDASPVEHQEGKMTILNPNYRETKSSRSKKNRMSEEEDIPDRADNHDQENYKPVPKKLPRKASERLYHKKAKQTRTEPSTQESIKQSKQSSTKVPSKKQGSQYQEPQRKESTQPILKSLRRVTFHNLFQSSSTTRTVIPQQQQQQQVHLQSFLQQDFPENRSSIRYNPQQLPIQSDFQGFQNLLKKKDVKQTKDQHQPASSLKHSLSSKH